MNLDENLPLLGLRNGQLLDDELGALGFADRDLARLWNVHGQFGRVWKGSKLRVEEVEEFAPSSGGATLEL
jgi:hypothetical protein